jgi:hypothetical protein
MTSTGSSKGRKRAAVPQTYPHEIELERIVPLREAAHLRGCSVDTLRRRFSHKIVRISPRRLGMKIRDAVAAD